VSVHLYFLLQPLEPHALCDEQADRQRRDGHHHGVGEEVEEVEERHSQDRDESERSVSEAGERAEGDHDRGHDGRSLDAAPSEFIHEGRNSALRERDRTCERGEKDQCEEQDPDEPAKAHAREDLGHRHEHQGRAGLQGLRRVIAGERENGGNDHHTCQDRDQGVKEFDLPGGIFDADLFFHIGAECDEDTHRDGQRVEHLPHGGDDGHPREVLDMRHQKIDDALHRARTRDRIYADHDREDQQDRHHDP